MRVIPFTYNDRDDLCANTYVIIDESNNCVVVDPSCDYPGIDEYIKKNNLNLKGVLVTHTHFDHIKGVDALLGDKDMKIRCWTHFEDIDGYTNTTLNCSCDMGKAMIVKRLPSVIWDEEELNIFDEIIKPIYTPFHTKGSLCFYLKDSKMLFSGDTLFAGSVGRTDLPGACPRKMRESLDKLMKLPDDVKVYPGHGPITTIGKERKGNPFIR